MLSAMANKEKDEATAEERAHALECAGDEAAICGKRKLKRMIQSSSSFFTDVKRPGCLQITTVFRNVLKRKIQSPGSFFMDGKFPGCLQITAVFAAAAAISKAGTPTVFAWESTTEWQFHWGSHEARPQALWGWAWVGGRGAPPPSPPTPGLFLGPVFVLAGTLYY
jgi:ribosomal protein S27E